MNNKLTNFVSLAGNASQIIIAGSILAELYFKFHDHNKKVADYIPDDDDDTPSPSTPLANAA